jgi:hypothetical protein
VAERQALKQRVEERLDAPIRRAQVIAQQPRLLAVTREQIAPQVEQLDVARALGHAKAHGGELQRDCAPGAATIEQRDLTIRLETDLAFEIHRRLLRSFDGYQPAAPRDRLERPSPAADARERGWRGPKRGSSR